MSKTALTRIAAASAAVAAGALMSVSAFAIPAQAASLSSSQISAILSLLSAFGADSATISNVTAALNGTAMTSTSSEGSGSMNMSAGPLTVGAFCNVAAPVAMGTSGTSVQTLQQCLISHGFTIPAGATGYYGAETATAVAQFNSWEDAQAMSASSGTSMNTNTSMTTSGSEGSSALDAQLQAADNQLDGLSNDLSVDASNAAQNDNDQ